MRQQAGAVLILAPSSCFGFGFADTRTAQQFAVHHSQPADAAGSLSIQAGAQA
jgi:hypothetical protein